MRLQDQELHSILLKDDINTWYMGSKTMDQVTPSAVSLSPCLQHPTPVLVEKMVTLLDLFLVHLHHEPYVHISTQHGPAS